MALTDLLIRATKPSAKTIRLSDAHNLYLLIQPDGARYWRMDYAIAGKRKTLSLGVYPDVSLQDARKQRDANRELIANGVDPSENRKAKKAAVTATVTNCFEVVAREF